MDKNGYAPLMVIFLSVFLFFPSVVQAEKNIHKFFLDNSNIRLKPELKSALFDKAPLGTILESKGQSGDRFKINLYQYPQTALRTVSPEYPATARRGMGFSVKFCGGMNYLFLNDMNDGLQGLFDLINDDPFKEVIDGQYKPFHLGFDLGGEIIINLTSQFGIGLGGGYMQVTKESLWETNNGGTEDAYSVKPKVKAIPLTAALYLSTSPDNPLRVSLFGGAGYYLGSVDWQYLYLIENNDFTYKDEHSWQSKSNSFGYHGGLSFEFDLGNSLAFVVEGLGRYVKLKDLTGNFTIRQIEEFEGSQDESLKTEENALYWHADRDYVYTGKTYPWTIFSHDKPSGSNYSNVRKGVVDLTGFSVRAGIKIRFK